MVTDTHALGSQLAHTFTVTPHTLQFVAHVHTGWTRLHTLRVTIYAVDWFGLRTHARTAHRLRLVTVWLRFTVTVTVTRLTYVWLHTFTAVYVGHSSHAPFGCARLQLHVYVVGCCYRPTLPTVTHGGYVAFVPIDLDWFTVYAGYGCRVALQTHAPLLRWLRYGYRLRVGWTFTHARLYAVFTVDSLAFGSTRSHLVYAVGFTRYTRYAGLR